MVAIRRLPRKKSDVCGENPIPVRGLVFLLQKIMIWNWKYGIFIFVGGGSEMTELEKAMKNLADAMADLARRDAESTEELKRSIAESRRESEASRREYEASRVEYETSQKATNTRLAAAIDELQKLNGAFGNRIGDLTEKILVPGIRPKMRSLGHDFSRLSTNEEFYARKGVRFAEIDLFLENPTEAMAVEVKTRMRKDDVTTHLGRLEALRKHEDIAGVKGKLLYGAMAGLVIDESARELALDNGLYIVEMVEDSKHVNVVEPPAGVRGW